MSGVISGLIGGAIAVMLTSYVASKVGKAGRNGELRFGGFMWGLAFACLAFALLPIAMTLFAGHNKEFWAKVFLSLGFGTGALYCFGEAALVRGKFDDGEIEFSTPWTGRKHEKWIDLVSICDNAWCNWFTLEFKSGAKIRLSRYLGGHLSALEVSSRHAP